MIINIDKAGRVVLPKNVRAEFGFTPSTDRERLTSAEGILLRPVAEQALMQQHEGLWVHQGKGTTNVDWSQATGAVREERADSAWKA